MSTKYALRNNIYHLGIRYDHVKLSSLGKLKTAIAHVLFIHQGLRMYNYYCFMYHV